MDIAPWKMVVGAVGAFALFSLGIGFVVPAVFSAVGSLSAGVGGSGFLANWWPTIQGIIVLGVIGAMVVYAYDNFV